MTVQIDQDFQDTQTSVSLLAYLHGGNWVLMPDQFSENPSENFLCHRQDKMWNLWLSHQTEAGSIMIHIECVKYFKTNFNSTDNSRFLPKGALPLHLNTVYFSQLSYIQDQHRKCIHISKPLTVISSCCWWNKQIIILSFVKKTFFLVCYYISNYNRNISKI